MRPFHAKVFLGIFLIISSASGRISSSRRRLKKDKKDTNSPSPSPTTSPSLRPSFEPTSTSHKHGCTSYPTALGRVLCEAVCVINQEATMAMRVVFLQETGADAFPCETEEYSAPPSMQPTYGPTSSSPTKSPTTFPTGLPTTATPTASPTFIPPTLDSAKICYYDADATVSGDGLTVYHPSSGHDSKWVNFYSCGTMTAGVHYVKFTVDSLVGQFLVGVGDNNLTTNRPVYAAYYYYLSSYAYFTGNGDNLSVAKQNDEIVMKVDFEVDEIRFWLNDEDLGVAKTGISGDELYIGIATSDSGAQISVDMLDGPPV